MVIKEPSTASGRLFGLGLKLYPYVQKRSYSIHVEAFSKKIEQETEKLCRQGEVLVILK